MTERPDYIKNNVVLAPYTTFKIGGIADYFVNINNESELVSTLDWAIENSIPTMVLGGGSNVVFADAGYRGLVIRINNKGIKIEPTEAGMLVTVAAGEKWDKFVSQMVASNFSGLENLSGIPGKVGASPVQNIGAYGVEVGERIVSVYVYDMRTKKFFNLEKSECNFSYRHSIFKNNDGKNLIILAVTFLLDTTYKPILDYPDIKKYFSGINPTVKEIREVILEIRSQKFPDVKKNGTAGSFFKNPIVDKDHYHELKKVYPALPAYLHTNGSFKISAAWLIDKVAKYKGKTEGNVGTHDSQALVFVNYNHATAKELDQFAKRIHNLVFERTGIKLEREVCFVSEK